LISKHALVVPQRVLDTRNTAGGPIGYDETGALVTVGQLPVDATRRYSLHGRTFGTLSVPGDVKGALVNVTLSQAGPSGGYVTLYPGAGTAPNASTVNPATSIAASFWWTGIPTGASFPGTFGAFSAAGPRDLIVDLVGYYR